MMKKVLLAGLAAIGIAMAPQSADAAMVSYYTEGVFGSTGTNVVSSGAGAGQITLTFNAVDITDEATPSNVSFGNIDASGGCNANNATCNVGGFAGDTFTLKVFQTAPGAGNNQFVGSMSGVIRNNNSTLFVQFAAPFSFTIGTVTYELLEADGGVAGRSIISSSQQQPNSIEGRITARDVPEPVTLALLGLGLVGAGAIRRRSRR